MGQKGGLRSLRCFKDVLENNAEKGGITIFVLISRLLFFNFLLIYYLYIYPYMNYVVLHMYMWLSL